MRPTLSQPLTLPFHLCTTLTARPTSSHQTYLLTPVSLAGFRQCEISVSRQCRSGRYRFDPLIRNTDLSIHVPAELPMETRHGGIEGFKARPGAEVDLTYKEVEHSPFLGKSGVESTEQSQYGAAETPITADELAGMLLPLVFGRYEDAAFKSGVEVPRFVPPTKRPSIQTVMMIKGLSVTVGI